MQLEWLNASRLLGVNFAGSHVLSGLMAEVVQLPVGYGEDRSHEQIHGYTRAYATSATPAIVHWNDPNRPFVPTVLFTQ